MIWPARECHLPHPLWGTADAEIKLSFTENARFFDFYLFKLEMGQEIALFVCFTCCQDFCFYIFCLLSLFKFLLSFFFLCVFFSGFSTGVKSRVLPTVK